MTLAETPVAVSLRMQTLLERLRCDGDRVFGSRRIQVIPVAFQKREWSEVARVRVDTSVGTRHVFAKVLKPKKPGPLGVHEAAERLRHDFDVTTRVFEATNAHADLRAVEPLACYEDLLGVVTREAPGQPLDVLISKNAAWPTAVARLKTLKLAITRVGRWVAAFQEIAQAGPSAVGTLDDIRAYIDVRLKRLTGLPPAAFKEADRAAVLAYFDRRAAEVSSSELADVPVHGDITPSNVMATRECVTVLDFGMTARGCRYLDIARLYTQLEFYTAKPQYRPQVMCALQDAALAGFEPGLTPDKPLFEICAVQHVVCHLLSHARQPGPFPASIYSQHQCRRHRHWLRERARTPAVRTPAHVRLGSVR